MKDEGVLTTALAHGLRTEREGRGWSLAELAERSGVSRAMISKVERGEASPTAALLGRLVAAFGMTLSMLLAKVEGTAPEGRLQRWPDQPVWRDPATGYLRRAVTVPGAEPEIVEVVLPAGGRVDYPAASYAGRAHAVLVLEGRLLSTRARRATTCEGGTLSSWGLPPTAPTRTKATHPAATSWC